MWGPKTKLVVQCFGRFEVRRESESTPIQSWGRRKTEQLLKVLLQNRGKILTQDQLLEFLFPDLDPQKSIQNLHGRISELRRVLEPALTKGSESRFIKSVGKGKYYFPETDECMLDIEEFEFMISKGNVHFDDARWVDAVIAYRQAESLYTGPYLEEDMYEDWAIGRRDSLQALLVSALSKKAKAHSQMREFSEAIDCCNRIHEMDPYNEQVYRQKILYYYRSGAKNEAMRAYQHCKHVLERDLNVSPAPETELLFENMRDNKIFPTSTVRRTRQISEQGLAANRANTVRSQAELFYEKGKFFLNRQSAYDAKLAEGYFKKAVRKDSGHAPSYAGLADAYSQQAWFNLLPVQEVYPKAKWAISKAMTIDDQLPDAHVSRAYLKMNFEWDACTAYKEIETAIELDPNHAMAYRCMAGLLAVRGEFRDGIRYVDKAYQLDPLSFTISVGRAWIYYLAQQHERVVEQCLDVLEMDSTHVRARSLLGKAYEQLGKEELALLELRKANKLSRGNLTEVGALGHLYGKLGEHDRAHRVLSHLNQIPGELANFYHQALIYMGMSQEDRAYESLQQAWSGQSWNSIFIYTDPRFGPMSKYPPFQKMSDEFWSY